jgi:hypothetical protein
MSRSSRFSSPALSHALNRRDFLRTAAGLAAVAALPDRVLAEPYGRHGIMLPPPDPVRIRGRVMAAGRGMAGVSVNDGRGVVATDGDGRFELLSSTDRSFLSCSLPSGHRIPVNTPGTARTYRPILPDRRGEMDALFELEALPGGDEAHTMYLLPDIQTQNAWEMARFHELSVPDVQRSVAASGNRHAFGIACGDIMYDDLAMYPEYERGVTRMGIPFFQVIGKHDLDYVGAVD